jgi:adenylate cyclase
VPLAGSGRFLIRFTGYRPERVTSALDVLSDDYPSLDSRIAGKIVIIGASAQGLSDIRKTPLDGQVAGVTLHAEIIEQILTGTFLSRPGWMTGFEALMILLAGIVTTGFLLIQKPLPGLVVTGVLVGVFIGGSWWAFTGSGFMFDPLFPSLTALVTYLPGTAIGLFLKERHRRALLTQFRFFLDPTMIEKISSDPDTMLTPGGAERELSVMFIDMRRFSTLTETMAPEDVVRFVNLYLTELSQTIIDHGGTIDKFIGDAIMAFWNAPVSVEDHALRASRAALAVAAKVDVLNARLEADGLPCVEIGVGVNTGLCAVGLMGSSNRLSYTCIGDAVNLAARLEALTPQYGLTTCVGSETAKASRTEIPSVQIDLVTVKGRARPEPVFVLLETPEEAGTLEGLLTGAREQYLARNWEAATQSFLALAETRSASIDYQKLARCYLDRIKAYSDAPPPADWDGAFAAPKKQA